MGSGVSSRATGMPGSWRSACTTRPCIAPKTVGNYAAQIKAKLEVGSLRALTRLAIRHKLIEP